MAFDGINIPNLVDTTFVDNRTIVTNNYLLTGSGQGIISAGISGSPQFTGSLGMLGLGSVTVSLATGASAYGFSGQFTVSGNPQDYNAGVYGYGVSGQAQRSGVLGFTGVGNVVLSMETTNTFGFSSLIRVSGIRQYGTLYYVFPSTIDIVSNSLIPDLYINTNVTGYEFSATLKVPCSGQSILGTIKKNDVTMFAFEVPTGIRQFVSGVTNQMVSGDVISATLTRVGSTHAGTTLTLGINVTK